MKKIKNFLVAIMLLLISFSSYATALSISGEKNQSTTQKIILENNLQTYYNLTVFETWDMLNTTSEDKPVLIDVRRIGEYINERIQTPYPDDWPRWFPYEYRDDGPTGAILNEGILLQLFIKYFDGEDIILYCRTANRSDKAAKILVENSFNGKIYNMLGGIVEWKDVGLPVTTFF